ncbi:hypothetical protein [Kitasatospora sp. GAS204B]|uniref:hypothetical protein n=1 Tax=unclassified Kitasatospora TaxID=2633591 RepID=UPI002473405D|nr:hypothetical protein [Kitasatospora sp. GAS204B]MDH6122811.1 hypothetical protein [Kitasatospora sp. GAS204B]
MTCADYRAAMSAHLDGEFTDDDGPPPSSSHPTRCADCAGWLAGARRLRALTLAAPGPCRHRSQRLVAAVLDALGADERVGNSGTSVVHEGS